MNFYKYGNSEYLSNIYFQISLYVSTFIRNIATLFLEISLNIILLIALRNHYKKKLAAGATNHVMIKKNEKKKIYLAIVMCSISTICHIFSIIVAYFIKFGLMYPAVIYIGPIAILVNTFRHTINFFIFYNLNKKFKKNIYCKFVCKFNRPLAVSSEITSQKSRDRYSQELATMNNGIQLKYINQTESSTNIWYLLIFFIIINDLLNYISLTATDGGFLKKQLTKLWNYCNNGVIKH